MSERMGLLRITPKMRRQLTGFAFATGGMVLLSCNYITAKSAMRGFNPKTFAASFCTALQFTLGKFGGEKNIPPLVMNVYRTGVAAIALTLVTLALGEFNLANARPHHWAALLLGALIGPCLSVTLIYTSYRYWEMTRTAMVLTLQPLAVLPMAWLLFRDVPGGWKLGGGMIILAGGLWLVALHRPPHEKHGK